MLKGRALSAKVRAAHPWWTPARSRRYHDRWLEVRHDFAVRSVAAQKGAATKRRKAKEKEKQRAIREELKRAAAAKGPTEDWELTLRYSKKGKALGVTMRITAPHGSSRETVLLVAKRAGMAGGSVEKGYQVRDINWQKPRKSYDYGSDIETGLQVSGWTGLLAAGTIRLDRVKE